MNKVEAETMSDKHKVSWDGPYGDVYLLRCSCGWGEQTFANSPELSIGSLRKEHLESVQEVSR